MVPARPFSSQVIGTARTVAQGIVSYVVAHVAVLQFLNPGQLAWLVDFVATAVILGAVTYALRWLETRQGFSFWPTLARRVAAVLMVGLTATQPVYAPARIDAEPLAVTYPDGTMERAAPEQARP